MTRNISDNDRLLWLLEEAGLPFEAWKLHGLFPPYFDADMVRDIIDAAIKAQDNKP